MAKWVIGTWEKLWGAVITRGTRGSIGWGRDKDVMVLGYCGVW